jgi:hypothetical protein
MIGVRNREGILGTDIFCKDGFVAAAAALLGATAVSTVIGLITVPLTFFWSFQLQSSFKRYHLP